MRVGDDGGSDDSGKMLRYSGATLSEHLQHSGEVSNETAGWRLQVTRNREQIVKPPRVNERNLRAAPRSLAHPVRQHWRLASQVAPDQQQRRKLLNVRDTHAKRRINRVRPLIAKVSLSQPNIDVRRAEPARNAPEQIQLFSGARSAGQHTQ